MTDVIVILYGVPELERRCIQSVMEHTENYKLTIYDNLQTKHNLAVLWNNLIRQSECEYICLLNSDTVVEPGWLKQLELIAGAQDVIVGPSTDNCHGIQNQGRGQGIEVVDSLSGFCILFPKRLWSELGGFDESYPLYGQESDFNRRARARGADLVWVKNVFIHHEGSASVKAAEARGEYTEAEEREKGARHYHAKSNLEG